MYGSKVNLIIDHNHMIIRSFHTENGLLKQKMRTYTFDGEVGRSNRNMRILRTIIHFGDDLEVEKNSSLLLSQGSRLDVYFRKDYGDKYWLYLDSYKLGQCNKFLY